MPDLITRGEMVADDGVPGPGGRRKGSAVEAKVNAYDGWRRGA